MTPRRSARGFSLIELMVSIAVLSTTISLVVVSAQSSQQAAVSTEGYVEDLRTLRDALRRVTDDVRSGDDVQVHDGDIAISVRGAAVHYRLDGNVLLRETDDGGERLARPIARRVAAFSVEPDGVLQRVTLELDRRDRRSAGRARVSASVACRTGAAR